MSDERFFISNNTPDRFKSKKKKTLSGKKNQSNRDVLKVAGKFAKLFNVGLL